MPKQALAAQLRRWSDLGDLQRIVVPHGDVIDHGPRQTLLEPADSPG